MAAYQLRMAVNCTHDAPVPHSDLASFIANVTLDGDREEVVRERAAPQRPSGAGSQLVRCAVAAEEHMPLPPFLTSLSDSASPPSLVRQSFIDVFIDLDASHTTLVRCATHMPPAWPGSTHQADAPTMPLLSSLIHPCSRPRSPAMMRCARCAPATRQCATCASQSTAPTPQPACALLRRSLRPRRMPRRLQAPPQGPPGPAPSPAQRLAMGKAAEGGDWAGRSGIVGRDVQAGSR